MPAMATGDFDLDGLARYLHLSLPQLAKMADRGQLPGRKIGGTWRFSEAEIHHWLEDRIGVSGETELVEVEGALDRAGSDAPIVLAEMLPREAIAIPLAAKTRSSTIQAISELAASTGWLWDPARMAQAVQARENLHPTALDNGVALLHPRRPLPGILSESLIALGRTSQGVPFGSRTLTDLFFLICSTNDRDHLRILARLSRLVSDESYLAALRSAETPADALRATRECEQRLAP